MEMLFLKLIIITINWKEKETIIRYQPKNWPSLRDQYGKPLKRKHKFFKNNVPYSKVVSECFVSKSASVCA